MTRRAIRSVRRNLDLEGVIFVLGKGGTGKSVISEGLSMLAAEKGETPLLVRIGETLHESSPGSSTIAPSKNGFDSIDLDPRVAMDEFVQKVVRVRPLVARITGSEIYRKFFAAAPGLPELVLLGRIREYSMETERHGARRWSTIIVDCPSSGHGLLMLETPFAAFRAVPIGPFGRLASQIMEWLSSAARVAMVAIPEEMAVVEAIEFADDLRERTGIRPAFAFLNRVRRESLSAAARLALAEGRGTLSSNDRILLDCAMQVQRKARLEAFHHRRLSKGLGLDPILLADLPNCRAATIAKALSGEAQ